MTIEGGDTLGFFIRRKPEPEPEPELEPEQEETPPADPFELGIGATLRSDL